MTELQRQVLQYLKDDPNQVASGVADEFFDRGIHSGPKRRGLYRAQMYLGKLKAKGWVEAEWRKSVTLWNITAKGRDALAEQ